MAKFFGQFRVLPGNFYSRLLQASATRVSRLTIATLNYDLLIEQALRDIALNYWTHTGTSELQKVSLLKLHGSCGFLPDLGSNRIRFGSFQGNGSDVEWGLRVVTDYLDIVRWCDSEQAEGGLAPAMSFYGPGKIAKICRGRIEELWSIWQESVLRADLCVILGVALNENDSHVWTPVQQTTAHVIYVDPFPASFIAWADAHRQINTEVWKATFSEALPRIREDSEIIVADAFTIPKLEAHVGEICAHNITNLFPEEGNSFSQSIDKLADRFEFHR